MNPEEIYVADGLVYVLWETTGSYMVISSEGVQGEQFVTPAAQQAYPNDGWADW